MESLGIDYERITKNLRDSIIKRFEYSIDLLWKYLKTYLAMKLQLVPDIISLNTIIREACRAGLISEKESETLLDMIKKRNLTSHIYQEEIAQLLLADIPTYSSVMQTIISNITPN